MTRRGILLAGGTGTRMHPLTVATSKQLLPVYDKPMIYYPLTTLMLAGIQQILVISTPRDLPRFEDLLHDGSQWGVSILFAAQNEPKGIAHSLIVAESFLDGAPSVLILGDNIFFGHGLAEVLVEASANLEKATILGYAVKDTSSYGVVVVDEKDRPIELFEKPDDPQSNLAVTGLYFYPSDAPRRVTKLTPSARGELEITDLNSHYLATGDLRLQILHRGFAWLDTGTPESLHQAASFVQAVQVRQGMQIASPEEVAWRMGFIDDTRLLELATAAQPGDYGDYLASLLNRMD